MQIPTSSGSVLHIDLSFFYFCQPIVSDACVFVFVCVCVHVCNKIPIIHRLLYAPWSLIDGTPEIIYACYYYMYIFSQYRLNKLCTHACLKELTFSVPSKTYFFFVCSFSNGFSVALFYHLLANFTPK